MAKRKISQKTLAIGKSIMKRADELQAKSGSTSKTVKVTKYKMKRTDAVKQASKEYRQKRANERYQKSKY